MKALPEDNMWRHMQDGLLQLYMLKRNRRGAYADGATNAETFWPAVQPLLRHCNLLQCMASATASPSAT